MEFSPLAVIVIGLVLAAWTVGAAALIFRAEAKARRSQALMTSVKRMRSMLDGAPALPVLVRVDGRIEAPDRLALWLGLDADPEYLTELDGGQGKGLSTDQVNALAKAVQQTQKTAAPFQFTLTPPGSTRSLSFLGTLADPQVSPGGAALIWIFDFSESQAELTQLRERAARAQNDFAALVGLIEAAPVPMWFRGKNLKLQLVNQAYVEAVGAENAQTVIAKQIELLEPELGKAPAEIAKETLDNQSSKERVVTATLRGERRTLRVSNFPLKNRGVTGYAIDIEEQEQQARQFRAYREAQRAMLDQLSVGVAMFDPQERLSFANRPFRRLFGLTAGIADEGKSFSRFLSDAREKGCTPEVRDFPEWRAEHSEWFDATEMVEEAWPLPGGTHVRIVAQPMPDGGLVIIAEDRTEQLALSATRDILLRTRTATLDSLFEALAIFAPDGSVQLWNRSFAGTWGLASEFLDTHPSADALLDAIAQNLAKPEESKEIGAAVRAATLDRREKDGIMELADGRTLRYAGIPLPDGNGLLTVLDITASQEAEKALRERAIALEEADAVKARFLANMSYEFRTPLTSIGGFAELIKSGAAGDVSDQAGEYVDAIIDSVARLTEQVENVLDLSQSEAGLMPVKKEEVELLGFLTDIVREREQQIINADLSLDLKGRKGRKVDADPMLLGRAIGNLLDNAISGTPKGGHVKIQIMNPTGRFNGARIVISDNGKGMTAAELKRANTDYKFGEKRDSEKRHGLGIPLSRELIEVQGGELQIDSVEGEGTTVVIQLP